MNQVLVVDFDPKWKTQFEALRILLLDSLQELALSIEHVGSTSVPGISAKPVIDIDVVVSPENVTLSIERLQVIGYIHLGDLGIPDREALKSTVDSVTHNLYVCPTNSLALANHLAVRDYLRRNSRAARDYGELKVRLATEYSNDIDGYVEAKSGFLLEILRRAGFDILALAEIERVNRKQ
jgi:GrpB-like predicted nucleotidyltransferase (UPF0157 family)